MGTPFTSPFLPSQNTLGADYESPTHSDSTLLCDWNRRHRLLWWKTRLENLKPNWPGYTAVAKINLKGDLYVRYVETNRHERRKIIAD